MSRIQEIAAASAAAIDSVHAEMVRLVPMAEDQHAGRLVDAARPSVEIAAPLLIDSGIDMLDTAGRNDMKRIGNGASVLYIARDLWPAETDLRKGDIVVALDRDGAPRFAVDSVDKRPRARIIVQLSGLGHA